MHNKRKILAIILFQDLLPRLMFQRWEFPEEIEGLIGSCMEIPCTFYPRRNSGTFTVVWYAYHRRNYLQIFNSRGSSSVLMEYRGRTSLVPGSNSCALRIDPVRRSDGNNFYYPGIAENEKTNSWTQSSKLLNIHVTDIPSKPELTGNGFMIEGKPETVICSVRHTCGSSPPSLKWNKPGQTERGFQTLPGGYWTEISKLKYIPSHEDDKTLIQCNATYHHGKMSNMEARLNIEYTATGVKVIVLHSTKQATELKCIFLKIRPNVTLYTWLKDRKPLLNTTGQILVLDSKTRKSGTYSCIVHNRVGNSTSANLDFEAEEGLTEEDNPNLLLILGVLTGIILLLFLVVVVYFVTRKKIKPTALPSPIHGEINMHFPTITDQEDELLEQEHLYGNIQINSKVLPKSFQLPNSTQSPGEQSFAIYSNEEFIKGETDLEYSAIAHDQSERRQNSFTVDPLEDVVSYAAVKY